MKTILLIALTVSNILNAQVNERYFKVNDSLKNFICDVVYKVEEGDKDTKAKRWTTRPTIQVHADNGYLKRIEALFAETYNLALIDAQPGGRLDIHIGKQSELRKIAKDSYDIDLDGAWQYWTWWNGNSEINRAVILIANDRTDDLDRLLNITCMRSLGLPSSSSKKYESILSEKFDDAIQITGFDKYLIKFYYSQVPPGTTRSKLRDIIKDKWNEVAN